MTFRDRMPLGQAYNAHGQQQFQQPMHHEVPPEQHHQYQYQQQPQPHQQHQYRPQLPQPQQFIPSAQTQTAYSHYPPGGFPNGNQQQYQHNQYVQPTFPQHQAQPQPQPQRQPQPQAHQPHHQQQHHAHQPPPLGQQSAQFYPSSAAPAQFQTNYNGAAFNQQPSVLTTTPAPSPSSAPLPQFVNPSLLQTQPVPPPSRPASHAASPVSQPAPSPAATMSPQLTPAVRTPQPGQRVLSTKTQSPRIEKKEPPSRHGPALQIPKENRRPSTGAGVAKSPATPATPGGSSHAETLPLLLCVAEDCFEKADAAAQKIAKTMTSSEVAEHHKLVATGLGCLDTALKSNKLWPRLEARLCLRYASVLTEQTTNIMEAETTLTRGIAVCDKNRFLDLKYCSQFLLMKTLFQRNQNAAFKLIEGHITDCGTFRHVHWIYAFRFLKASFYLQSGNAADHHAIENLRRLSGVAAKREDHSIFAVAMLLEALTHLAAMKDDWATRVQMCIAQVAKLQMETSVHFPQVDVLLILLDLACSLHQKTHHISLQKVSLLQRKLDELKTSDEWPTQAGEMLLPINRMPNTLQTISNDTRAVLRVGEGNVDYLVLSTLGKEEAWALSWVFNGIVAHHKSSSPGRCSSMWSESVRLLEDRRLLSTSKTLPEHLREEAWAKEIICYANVLIGLQAAGISDWKKVRQCIDFVRQHKPSTRFLDILLLYLEGVFWQGSADLAKALEIWRDKRLEVEPSGALKNGSRLETEVSILAALSRLWILQEPGCRDEAEIAELVDTLRPICEDNPDLSIRTAFGLVMSSAPFGPTATLNQAKAYLQVSLNGARDLNNTQYLSIALNIMRSRLFENVVGEQALKSAKAAATQARKSGNILWMSVAEGMLAQSYEMQGQINEAKIAHENGVRLANEAYAKTRVD